MNHRTDVFFTSSLIRTHELGVWPMRELLRDRQIGHLLADTPSALNPPVLISDGQNECFQAESVTRLGVKGGVTIDTALGYRFTLPDEHPIIMGNGRTGMAGEITPGDGIRLRASCSDSRMVITLKGDRLEPGFYTLLGVLLARGRYDDATGYHSALGIPEYNFDYWMRKYLEKHSARMLQNGDSNHRQWSFTITDEQLNEKIDVILNDDGTKNIQIYGLYFLPLRDLAGILSPFAQLAATGTRVRVPEWFSRHLSLLLLMRFGIITRRECPQVINLHRGATEFVALLKYITQTRGEVSPEERNPLYADTISSEGVFTDHIISVNRIRGELLRLDGYLPEDSIFTAGLP